MGLDVGRSNAMRGYDDLSARRDGQKNNRFGYLLGVSAVLGIVTFALVYLTTFSFTTGF